MQDSCPLPGTVTRSATAEPTSEPRSWTQAAANSAGLVARSASFGGLWVAGGHASQPPPLAVDPLLGGRRHFAAHPRRLDHSPSRWRPAEPARRPLHFPPRRHLGCLCEN